MLSRLVLIGRDPACSPAQLTEAASEPGPSRKRGTSLSITYNDSENSAYPWYFQLQVEDDDDNEDSEILSIQVRHREHRLVKQKF